MQPATLLEAIKYFSDPGACLRFVADLRWPEGVSCPRCQAQQPRFIKTRRLWECKGCRKQFSVKVGTIFEDSALPLDKWLCAIWLIVNSKNGVRSEEHTSELQSLAYLVCRLLLEKKNKVYLS